VPFHVKPAGNGPARASIASLARRYELSEAAGTNLSELLDLLVTDPHAPTSVRVPQRAVDDHLADALVALEFDEVRSAKSIADIGAGAGIPGLPLAVARPDAEVVLVESSRRKCEFIARAIERCGATNARVACVRAESWTEGRERFDLVTARALAALPVVAEYAAPLLRLGGALLAWRGRRDPAEEAAALQAADELGLELREPRRVVPYVGATNRHLQLLVKSAPTPARFPRRPGMARKRPLGVQRRRSPGD
jgi:16S rRNA (guanine527-N7)-methyltransferase